MARFSADGQDYTRALALGTQAALTVSAWIKLSVNRATYSTTFFIDNGTGDNWGMQCGADGVTMATVFDASTQEGMGVLTVGAWYYVCLTTSGTTGTLYYKRDGASSLTVQAVTSVTASVNAATLRLGESPWGGEWWNGCLNAVKVWNRQLARAEVDTETGQYAPMYCQNLVAYYPLTRPEPLDYSGRAQTLAGGAGTTYEDGPPIPLRRIIIRPYLLTTAGSSDTALTDPAVAGVRVGSTVDTAAATVVLTDTAGGSRSGSTFGETTANGLSLSDPGADGIRTSSTTDTIAIGLLLADPVVGNVRSQSTSDTPATEVVLSDIATAVQAGTAANQLATEVVLADISAEAVRVGNTTRETATTALVIGDPNAGHLQLGGITGETVSAGTGVTDPNVGGIRLSSLSETLTVHLILGDTATGARLGSTVSTLAFSLILTDWTDGVRVSTGRESLAIAGPVAQGSIEPTSRATTDMTATDRTAPAMTPTTRTIATMGG